MSTFETYGNVLEDVKVFVSDDQNGSAAGQFLILNHIYVFDETIAGFNIDTRNMNFKRFLNNFWKVLIDVKDRMTINDGKTGGYPVLQQIYLQYLQEVCATNNQYTYSKMLSYVRELGTYWIKLIEKMVPATTLWTSGEKVENSAFHRDKFVYRCFSPSGNTMPIIPNILLTGTTLSGYTSYPQARMASTPMMMSLPPPPPSGSLYFNNIISGGTYNPISSYANQYNINNQNRASGSELVIDVTNRLANRYHSNKDKYLSQSIFTKQGATDNILNIDGLKCFGVNTQAWIEHYNIATNNIVGNNTNRGTQRNNISNSSSGGGGGGY